MGSSLPEPGSHEDRFPTDVSDPPFPTLDEALAAIRQEVDSIPGTPYRLQIGLLASREVTWKVSVKESEDTVGGVVIV
jgi:hypothetical protein